MIIGCLLSMHGINFFHYLLLRIEKGKTFDFLDF